MGIAGQVVALPVPKPVSDQSIFTITAIRINISQVPPPSVDPTHVNVPWPVYSRTWGFSFDLEEAMRWVEANATDMNENGYYPWIVIEEWKGGLLLHPLQQIYFQHEGDYSKLGDMGRYVRLGEQPVELRELHDRFHIADQYAGVS